MTQTPPVPWIEPELAEALAKIPTEFFPPQSIDFNDLPGSRARIAARTPVPPVVEGVTVEDRKIPGPDGKTSLTIRLYRPEKLSGTVPGYYWIHGGGMVIGTIDGDNERMSHLARELGCIATSIDYRLAPENPHPVPVEDCYAGLVWVAKNAKELGIDPAKLAIGGASAGGGLAAATALLARDRKGPSLIHQVLVYPMLDDRNTTRTSHQAVHMAIWDRRCNIGGWKALLGDAAGKDGVSPYAAPARATDLAGLPPAFIDCGTADAFLDEDIDYAQRLMRAGVPVELHTYPGAFHGFEGMAPKSRMAAHARVLRYEALRRAFGA